MSDPAAAVRGLLRDIDRAASAFETVCGEIAGHRDGRVGAAHRERDAAREAEEAARTRAEKAEQATAMLRAERTVIRKALRAVTGAGDSPEESSH